MRIDAEIIGFRDTMADINGFVARSATFAMRETTPETLSDLRRQITDAGMGTRLANTWRGGSYPVGARVSVNPGGYIWSNAPLIIDAFARGATIRPVNGANFQWIPTKNVPRARGRVSRGGRNMRGGAMTPEEVENRFNTDFEYRPGKAGTVLAFIDVVRAKNMRGYRAATAGRQRQGRVAKPVLMFVLRKFVRMPKAVDLDRPAQRWADRYAAEFTRRLER